MFLLLLLLVVAVAVAGAGLLGVGALSSHSRAQRNGLLAAVSAPVVLIVGLILLAALVVGFGGAGRQAEDEPAAQRRRPDPAASSPATLPRARVQPVPAAAPVIGVFANAKDSLVGSPPVGGLVPGAVARVIADGFGTLEAGRAEQCVVELGRLTACAVPSPVQFDEAGHADFLFVVHGEVAPGGCRAGQPTCVLRVTGTVSGRSGEAQTVMVDPVVPGTVTVTPDKGAADGGRVAVAVAGFPAGTTATVVLCAPPAGYDASRCSAALSSFAVDATGSGRTTVAVAPGPVGANGVACGPRTRCGVMVLTGLGYVAAPVAPVMFSHGPGVAYAADRVLTGVLIAVVLVGLATAFALRTDWTKPTEAATPAMDESDLRAGDSLDELFGTDQELDARDPIPW